MQLLSGAASGTGAAVRVQKTPTPDAEQFFTLYVWGTFGGATVTLEISPGDGAWFDSGLTVTEAQAVNVEFKARSVRAVVTGGTDPAINAELL